MEILVVAIIALIAFGPRRLPEIARSVGKAFSEFRRQASEVRDEFESSLKADDDLARTEAQDHPLPAGQSDTSNPPADSDGPQAQ